MVIVLTALTPYDFNLLRLRVHGMVRLIWLDVIYNTLVANFLGGDTDPHHTLVACCNQSYNNLRMDE